MDVFTDETQGKHAVTHYKVLERFGYVTLVECTLETGRTHQIRVHMKSIGHRIFNDVDYGGELILKGTKTATYKKFIENCFALCPRQALHAKLLEIEHPATKKIMKFESDLPDDMKSLLDKWRNYPHIKPLSRTKRIHEYLLKMNKRTNKKVSPSDNIEVIGKRISTLKADGVSSFVIIPTASNWKLNLLFAWLFVWTLSGCIVIGNYFALTNTNTKLVVIMWLGFWAYFEFTTAELLSLKNTGKKRFG